jgi:hypothetical protein
MTSSRAEENVMRIVAYGNNGESALGVSDGESLVPLHDLDPSLPRDLKAILERPDGLEQVRRAVHDGGSAGRQALNEIDYDLPLA